MKYGWHSRIPLLAVAVAVAAALLGCLFAAPAGAVVGGTPANPEDYPWFTDIGSCGGMLVAPDRVLTAGHCVAGRPLDSLGAASFAGQYYKPVGFAMHPGWRKVNGDNGLEDVALVILDRPVAGVALVALSGPSEPAMTIIGRGRVFAPGTGHGEGESFGSGLRRAQLRPISDSECARAFRRARGNGGERFDAKRMLCAIDIDGQDPLSSGCNGDSGGPLFAGSPAAPIILGVVSFGGRRCGADRLPSVFAEVSHYLDFITGPVPQLAPTALSAAMISGTPRVGRRLTCGVTGYTSRPTRIAYSWQRQGGRRVKPIGHAKTYKVRKADAGHPIACAITATSDGGYSQTAVGPKSIVRVAR